MTSFWNCLKAFFLVFMEKACYWTYKPKASMHMETPNLQIQKLPPRGVLTKRCSENMKCNFATLFKLHFGMGVLL